MRAAVVQYVTTREAAQRNRELLEDVLNELAAREDGGVDYQVLVFDDGVGFMHVVAFDGTADPFGDCAAYHEFHREFGRAAGRTTDREACDVDRLFSRPISCHRR